MRRDLLSFQGLRQTYLNVSEDTASVHYVLFKVKDVFNGPSVELVTWCRYGLKIIDTDGQIFALFSAAQDFYCTRSVESIHAL